MHDLGRGVLVVRGQDLSPNDLEEVLSKFVADAKAANIDVSLAPFAIDTPQEAPHAWN